jgi:SPP1 family predicted phage head-tail adaptor
VAAVYGGLIMEITLEDLNKRGSFGAVLQVPNEKTDGYEDKFVPGFKRWYGVKTRTRPMTYQVYGTELQDTIDIVIRHDDSIKPPLMFQSSDGLQYDIVSSSPDDTGALNAFDILTLKQVTRKGAKNG